MSSEEREDYELVQLRRKSAELESRLYQQEQREIGSRKEELVQRYQYTQAEQERADKRLAQAVAESNGDEVAEALRHRDETRNVARTIESEYQQLEAAEKRRTAAKPRQETDPVVARYAKNWISENSWYDPHGRDMDSKIVLTIDQSLVDEGYAPRTAHYWKELNRRVKQRLPHHFESQEAQRPQKRQIYISPERKEALVQAGVWDDPKLRMKYVKRYQAWDRENA